MKEDWFSYFLSGAFTGMAISMLVIIAGFPAYVSVSAGTILELIAAAVLSIIMFVIACARKTKHTSIE